MRSPITDLRVRSLLDIVPILVGPPAESECELFFAIQAHTVSTSAGLPSGQDRHHHEQDRYESCEETHQTLAVQRIENGKDCGEDGSEGIHDNT